MENHGVKAPPTQKIPGAFFRALGKPGFFQAFLGEDLVFEGKHLLFELRIDVVP